MTRLRFQPVNQVVDARPGDTVLETAIKFDVPIEHACGGFCACTTCHIHVEAGGALLSEPEADETDRLCGVQDFSAVKSRLACQARIKPGTVEVCLTIQNVSQ